jgi:hypothetical protein
MAYYVSDKIELVHPEGEAEFYRADLEFSGVDHSGSSFEARVFLNNEEADQETQRDEAVGYAGSFYVFGHGNCYGDAGHCDVPDMVDAFDRRRPHQLVPQNYVLTVTRSLKALIKSGTTDIRVTVVPIVVEGHASALEKDQPGGRVTPAEDVLKFEELELLLYD